jgi:hypothetical protein
MTVAGTVTEAGLTQRINRKLRSKGCRLVRARGRALQRLGGWYVRDAFDGVRQHHVDLEAYGRELGALKPGEALDAAARTA